MVAPDPREKETLGKYDRTMERITKLLNQSFKAEDLTVLRRALEGDVQARLARLDLIVELLLRLRKALAAVEATQLLMGGGS